MFGPGTTSVAQAETSRSSQRSALGRMRDAGRALFGRPVIQKYEKAELQQGYFFVQEFLPGNEFDTRVTIIGNRAFAFRRYNRQNDFRASGSGKLNWDPAAIDLETVRLAFHVAQKLGTQSLAVDALRRGDERLIVEISYTYASWAVRDCPGHWVLDGDSLRGSSGGWPVPFHPRTRSSRTSSPSSDLARPHPRRVDRLADRGHLSYIPGYFVACWVDFVDLCFVQNEQRSGVRTSARQARSGEALARVGGLSCLSARTSTALARRPALASGPAAWIGCNRATHI